MLKLGSPNNLIRLTLRTLTDTTYKVKIQRRMPDTFVFKSDLRQSNPFSMTLFKLALENTILCYSDQSEWHIYSRMIKTSSLVDGVMITARTKKSLVGEGAFGEFEKAALKLGMQINYRKTVYMRT